jgi:hypothetical protein
MSCAEGAFSSQPGATPQEFAQRRPASAEGAIHFGTNLREIVGEPVR